MRKKEKEGRKKDDRKKQKRQEKIRIGKEM